MESRLTHIETKLALTEDLLDAVNQTVYRQQQQIDQLQKQIRMLYQQLHSGNEAEKLDLRDEIPPHY